MNDLEFSSLIMLYDDFRLFISQHGVFLEAVLSFMSFRVGFCFIQTVYGAYLFEEVFENQFRSLH